MGMALGVPKPFMVESSMSFDILWRPLLLPQERLFWPFILTTTLFVFLFRNKWPHSGFFSREIYAHPSAILDYKVFFINNIFRFFFLPILVAISFSSYSISGDILSLLNQTLGPLPPLSLGYELRGVIYTLMSFIIFDFFLFFQHYCMHKIPFLWKFHRVHHSAKVLTPVTVYRVHPIEVSLSPLRYFMAISLSTSLYVYVFQAPVHGYTFFGVNAFGFILNALVGNLRHTHVPLSFKGFEYFLVSPTQHQLHHHPEYTHKNLGFCLALWDQLFGSFLKTPRGFFSQSVGLKNCQHKSLREFYLSP